VTISYNTSAWLWSNAVGGSQSVSHSISASTTIIFVAVLNTATSNDVTSCTVGGQNCTYIPGASIPGSASGNGIWLYYLLNPPTGSQTVAVGLSSSIASYGGVIEYAGANGIGASNTNSAAAGTASSLTTSINPTVANSSVMMVGTGFDASNNPTAKTNATIKAISTLGAGSFYISSPVSAGAPPASFSMAFQYSGTSANALNGSLVEIIPIPYFQNYDQPNPRGYPPSRDLLTWLQSPAQPGNIPFAQLDQPNPIGFLLPNSYRLTWLQSPAVPAAAIAASPFALFDQPNPTIIVPRSVDLLTLALGANYNLLILAPPPFFPNYDQPNPVRLSAPTAERLTWVPAANYNLLIPAAAAAPFFLLDWPNPRVIGRSPLLLTQTQWPAVPSSGLVVSKVQASTTNAASVTLTRPPGSWSVGNCLIAVVTSESPIGATPAGWTLAGFHQAGSSNTFVGFYNIVISPGSQPGSYTFTSSGADGNYMSVVITEYSSAYTNGLIDQISVSATSGASTSTTFTFPSVTNSAPNEIVILASGNFHYPPGSYSAGFLEAQVTAGYSGATQFYWGTIVDFRQAAAGATGTNTATVGTADYWTVATISLQPPSPVRLLDQPNPIRLPGARNDLLTWLQSPVIPPPVFVQPPLSNYDFPNPRVAFYRPDLRTFLQSPLLSSNVITVLGNILSMRQIMPQSISIYLPINPVIGKLYVVMDTLGVSAGDPFIIRTLDGSLINGASSYSLSANFGAAGLLFDDMYWTVIFTSGQL
jgi:hypothetical protein